MQPVLPPFLLEAGEEGPDAVIAAVEQRGGAPLRVDGSTLFVYVGEADRVRLRHWMDVFQSLRPFERHRDTALWTLAVELPVMSRIEYKLSVRTGDRRRVILDPLNPRRARDPFGSNSVVIGPGYRRPEWSKRREGIDRGTVTELPIASDAFGGRRRARLYLPANGPTEPVPLLVAHDGSEYFDYASLGTVLDNLIHAGEIPAVACVLSDPTERNREYTGDDRHAAHVVEELIPAAAARVPVDGDDVVGLGASFGAVATLHAARRYPGVFSGLILQSGSFVTATGGRHRRGKVFAPVVEFMKSFEADPGTLPGRIHVSCGRFDGLAADNRRFVTRLRSLGIDVGYEEAADGHNWENWRDRLRAGLLHTLDR